MARPTKLMLLSSPFTLDNNVYLGYCETEVASFFRSARKILFVPYALRDRADYAAKARERFAEFGFEIESIHEAVDSKKAIERAEAIFVGGGNTFRLLQALYAKKLLKTIRNRVLRGMPYIGVSAGANIACPTIKTTNDMPIVCPPSLDALDLVSFQLNCHYFDAGPSAPPVRETCESRIKQFHEENDLTVVGLREGAWLEIEGDAVRLRGEPGAKLFRRGAAAVECRPNQSLNFELRLS